MSQFGLFLPAVVVKPLARQKPSSKLTLSKKIFPNIYYGGSVTDKTVADFSKKFSGALVGGASLKAQTFFDLIKNS